MIQQLLNYEAVFKITKNSHYVENMTQEKDSGEKIPEGPILNRLLTWQRQKAKQASVNAASGHKTNINVQRYFHEKFRNNAVSHTPRTLHKSETAATFQPSIFTNVALLQNRVNGETCSKSFQNDVLSSDDSSITESASSERPSQVSCYECHSSDSTEIVNERHKQTPSYSHTCNTSLYNEMIGVATSDFMVFMKKQLLMHNSEFVRQTRFQDWDNLLINVGPINPIALSRAFLWMRDGKCQLTIWDITSLIKLSYHFRMWSLLKLCLNYLEFFIQNITGELVRNGVLLQDDVLLLHHYFSDVSFFADHCCALVDYICHIMSKWAHQPPATAVSSRSLSASTSFPQVNEAIMMPNTNARKPKISWPMLQNTNEEDLIKNTNDGELINLTDRNLIPNQTTNINEAASLKDPKKSVLPTSQQKEHKFSSNPDHESLISLFLKRGNIKHKTNKKIDNSNVKKNVEKTAQANDEDKIKSSDTRKKMADDHYNAIRKLGKVQNSPVETHHPPSRQHPPAPSVVAVIPKQKPKITFKFL